VFALCCLLLPGCGSGDAQIFDISGTVTFDGKPVPAGRITIVPDFTKNNDGPQGWVDIRDGKFDTRQGGRKVIAGPVVLRIEGFDGTATNPKHFGNPIFNAYEIKLDLPAEASSHTLEVPKDAARGLSAPRTGVGP
jgi:hypothetical protein